MQFSTFVLPEIVFRSLIQDAKCKVGESDQYFWKSQCGFLSGNPQCGYFSKGKFRFRIQPAKSQFRVKKNLINFV